MRAFERLRHDMFSRVISKNVVPEPAWRARLNNSFIQWAMGQPLTRSEIPCKNEFERPEVNPRTQRYVEHTYGLQTSPAGGDPWMIELARLTIPSANTAIVKSFEQVVLQAGEETDVYSESQNWGNPFILPDGFNVAWHFRLERGDNPEPVQLNVSGVNPVLPGEPHFEVSQMNDLWFPASSPASQNIHWTIGGRYRFRVIAIVTWPVAYEEVSIAAKVRGFRLSSFDRFTILPIRSNW